MYIRLSNFDYYYYIEKCLSMCENKLLTVDQVIVINYKVQYFYTNKQNAHISPAWHTVNPTGLHIQFHTVRIVDRPEAKRCIAKNE